MKASFSKDSHYKKPNKCLVYKCYIKYFFCFVSAVENMAVNESESTNETKQIGKQKDGSVVASENDWCLSFVRNLPWGNFG